MIKNTIINISLIRKQDYICVQGFLTKMEEIIRISLSSGTVLTPLIYTDGEYYAFENTPYILSVESKNMELSCYEDGKLMKMTPDEEKFAKNCINHYRQIYNLPPIFENYYGGDENGTV